MEACLSSQPCLEQPVSPIPAERARATKKVRNRAPSESDPGVQITGGEESVKESFKEKRCLSVEGGALSKEFLLGLGAESEFLYQREVLVEGDGLVTTSELSYRYYSKVLLRAIEGMIGTIVKIDYNTTVGKRGKFARFRVVIDLNKPLPDQH
ncbi:hypothetical protein PVK06_027023 [Gossypium arboreum]|uniref:Uncharacterized protein n=1 Tax=Gossypium arboreum TaxID=29729 RepID=A0ABR0NZI9_GOSAR|nr:hypothetical protein PVK06_027023 [Gossypium arboreum]